MKDKTMKLFPAHAGVIPSERVFSVSAFTFPRPRGGDPNSHVGPG